MVRSVVSSADRAAQVARELGTKRVESTLDEGNYARGMPARTAAAHRGCVFSKAAKVTSPGPAHDDVVKIISQNGKSEHARSALTGRLSGEPAKQAGSLGHATYLII